jgi:predicted RNase H-like HicB family nuclease
MSETITLDIKLRAFIRKEKRNRWVAICPTIGVASQGVGRDDAMRSLKEAVELWFESCLERGVLDQAMREANFRPLASHEPVPKGSESVVVNQRPDEEDDDVLGDPFPIQITIPAYQAAALLHGSVM